MNQLLCKLSDLVPMKGTAAIIDGQQVALFYVPGVEPQIFAVQNWDPIGQANVISRGIVGDIKGELCVASPLYKQHFSLLTGECVEQPEIKLACWPVSIEQDIVYIQALREAVA